jgi:Flp pilus assembly protein TadD
MMRKRHLSTLLRLLVAALLLAAAAWLIARPDPRDDLRTAEGLFVAGRYYEALTAYARLAPALPAAELRLGLVQTLRGERVYAERAIRSAMQRGLSSDDYHLGLLYLGRALADAGLVAQAEATWMLLEDCRSPAACAYRGPGRLLAAEAALTRGAYAQAEAGLHAALAEPLPPTWVAYGRYRLALLRAADHPDEALALLAPQVTTSAPDDPLLVPLLPLLATEAGQLAAVLEAPLDQRPQLLGQFYLECDLTGLAEAQFARVDPASPMALDAAAYAAYTQWRAGDAAAGLARLEALVAASPEEPRARALLALAYLTTADDTAAREQIASISALTPNSPDSELAWASWHAARREYDLASLAYDRALVAAPRARLGDYALVAARFHLATTYNLCTVGLPMAELAARERPHNAEALILAAAHRYHCGQFAAALEAAQAAEQISVSPAAAYYQGVALAALGEHGAARLALMRAADLAPASSWRRRAEIALDYLP